MSSQKRPQQRTVVKVLTIVLALTLVASSAALLATRGPAGGRDTVAIVDGTPITRDQLYDRMFEEIGNNTLETMVVELLVSQEAERHDVAVTEEDISRALGRFISYFGSEQAFFQALSSYGITLEQLEQDMRMQVLSEKILVSAGRIEVSEDELEEFFETNRVSFGTPETVTASHILVDTEEEALDIIASLGLGEDFEDLALLHSVDPGSRDHGGSLGSFGRGDMVSEFEEAVFALQVGEISGPVESQFGFHIIRLDDQSDEVIPTLEDVREDVWAEIVSQKAGAMMGDWIAELKSDANIQYVTP